jgi:HEAT repeat protein
MKVDWPDIALKIKAGSCGGTEFAQDAIAEIVGSEAITDAVKHYITFMDGSELVRSVLILLRPKVAMEYCMKIYREDDDAKRRHAAIELLRNIGDRRAFDWVPELLSDPDPTIQSWAASMVDQLIFSKFIESEDCVELFPTMREHQNSKVRHYYNLISQHLDFKKTNSEPQR